MCPIVYLDLNAAGGDLLPFGKCRHRDIIGVHQPRDYILARRILEAMRGGVTCGHSRNRSKPVVCPGGLREGKQPDGQREYPENQGQCHLHGGLTLNFPVFSILKRHFSRPSRAFAPRPSN